MGATYEFNFFPYSTFRQERRLYTLYSRRHSAFVDESGRPFLSVPFSAGFKVNVANQVGIEIEYGFRKTFTDRLDGLYEITDPGGEPVDHSRIHNNDWYSFMGVSVTWKMYNRLAGCPAFAEVEKDKIRKRR